MKKAIFIWPSDTNKASITFHCFDLRSTWIFSDPLKILARKSTWALLDPSQILSSEKKTLRGLNLARSAGFSPILTIFNIRKRRRKGKQILDKKTTLLMDFPVTKVKDNGQNYIFYGIVFGMVFMVLCQNF